MDKYICECCGGKINRATMMCEYCGTQYKEDLVNDAVIRIETFHNPVDTLKASVIVPDEQIRLLGADDASEWVVRQLAHKFSEHISKYMVLENRFEPYERQHHVTATVKMVIPKEGTANWRGIE